MSEKALADIAPLAYLEVSHAACFPAATVWTELSISIPGMAFPSIRVLFTGVWRQREQIQCASIFTYDTDPRDDPT